MAIVDCLTLLVSNLMVAETPPDTALDRAAESATVAAGRTAPTVVVSNEVGMGVHPPTELGRGHSNLLGGVNQRCAAAADPSMLLVAGRAFRLESPWTLLDQAHRSPGGTV